MKFAFKAAVLSAAVAVAGFAMPVLAAPTPNFTVNTALFGYATPDFISNYISGSSSTLVKLNPDNIHQTGTGYTEFASFQKPTGGFYNANASGLNNAYSLWAEFTYTLTLASGVYATPNSTYSVSGLNFTLYGEKLDGSDSTFVQADDANAASGTVTHSGDVVKLGSGSSVVGVSSINGLTGTSLNATMNFALTAAGSSFFIDPVPFYDLAFSSFTNTSQGFTVNSVTKFAAINSASGGVDFNRVPEPTSVALLGLGLVALAASRRRRSVK